MPKTFSVQIPVSPYLKPYITRRFGDPIAIDNQSLVGVFLIGVLEKQNFNVGGQNQKKDIRFNYFTDSITCVAPISLMKDFGWNLKPDHIIQFNRFFEEHFDLDLHLHVERNVKKNTRYAGYKQAIESFAVEYNICLEETISFEGLKKMEYRYREKIKKKTFGTLSSPKIQPATLFS